MQIKRTLINAIKRTPFYKPLRIIYIIFRNIFFWNGWIRNYIIFPLKAFLRVHKIPIFYKDFRKIEFFKNKYNGKRCFIIATGPSLRIADVEKLQNEITFSVNSFFRIYDKTDFRSTYYVTMDPDAERAFRNEGNYDPSKYAKEQSFLNMQSMRKLKYKNTTYLPVCYQNHFYRLYDDGFDYGKNCRYTKDILWGIYDKYTITNAVIDIAIYMGFKEIFLLGVDCNYTGKLLHFIGDKNDKNFIGTDYGSKINAAMIAGYRFMERETKKRGIHIWNATRGGMLEEFDRIDFDTIDFIKSH